MPQDVIINRVAPEVNETGRENIEELIRGVNEAQDRLWKTVSHQHTAVYSLVDELTNRRMSNGRCSIRENEYIPKILIYADMTITHILHVHNDNEFLRGYYKQFITEPTEEFEARLSYVDALLQLAIRLDAFDGSNVFKDSKINIKHEWKMTKARVQSARKMVRGMENPNGGYITSSYKALMKFRELFINRFHEVDRFYFY